MLTTLAEKLDPKHCALLLVDLQNDFCAPNGAMDREGHDISRVETMLPRLDRLLNAARAARVECVWIRNVYSTKANWYLSEVFLEHAGRRRKGLFVQHPVCALGDWSGDFYRLRPLESEAVVSKHRYGAFEATDLDIVLRAKGIRTVVMTGVATNVCVETTARQAFMRDYYVIFTNDCTATYTQADHDATLRNIDHYFGQVVSGEDVTACWPAADSMVLGKGATG